MNPKTHWNRLCNVFLMKSELEVDFFLADENKLLATAYDHLSWSKGFSLSFLPGLWTMRSHDLLMRGM